MASEINYSVADYDGLKVIKLAGNIANSSKDEFENLVDRLSQKYDIILNFKEVNVITSGGLNSLIKVTKNARSRKKRVMLMGLREGLMKMMEVMEAYKYLTFVNSIEEGQARIKY